MEKTLLTIEGAEVFKIRKVKDAQPYKNGKRAENGENYLTYSYGNRGFSVHENDEFIPLLKKGEIFSVDLDVNDEDQLSLSGFITNEQKMAATKFQAKMARLNTIAAFQPKETTTEEEILALLK